MKQIAPCLWFDSEAQEAAKYYISIFPDSKIIEISYYNTETPSNKLIGSVLTVEFELNGQHFTALNGGPYFKMSEAISFQVFCKDQAEIDSYWEKLSANPENEQCGWCKDKFGVSWQIVPENIGELVKSEAGMKAMLDMKKIIIKDLESV